MSFHDKNCETLHVRVYEFWVYVLFMSFLTIQCLFNVGLIAPRVF